MIRRLRTRVSLLRETAAMALDTLWANKMRSVLTVLGVVIGITSIVGMTALIRGFDESLKDSIRSLGPKTIFVQRFGAVSFSSGTSFLELLRRPSLNAELVPSRSCIVTVPAGHWASSGDRTHARAEARSASPSAVAKN